MMCPKVQIVLAALVAMTATSLVQASVIPPSYLGHVEGRGVNAAAASSTITAVASSATANAVADLNKDSIERRDYDSGSSNWIAGVVSSYLGSVPGESSAQSTQAQSSSGNGSSSGSGSTSTSSSTPTTTSSSSGSSSAATATTTPAATGVVVEDFASVTLVSSDFATGVLFWFVGALGCPSGSTTNTNGYCDYGTARAIPTGIA